MKSKSKGSKKRVAFQISASLRDELKSEALKYSMSLDKFIENALEKRASDFFTSKDEEAQCFTLSRFVMKN